MQGNLSPLTIATLALASSAAMVMPAEAAFPTTTAEDVKAIVSSLEATVESQMDAWGTPGVAIGIVAQDRLVYAQGFGVQEKGASRPVTPDSIFEIGSTTKAFLGVTLAMCVEDGLLGWSDKVVDHDPTFQLADGHVTRAFQIDDLLAQRSGLPFSALTNMMVYGYERADILRALRYVEPVSSFRSRFAYQNAFHIVADGLVAKLAGTPDWDTFLDERLLQPLHMHQTTSSRTAVPDAEHLTAGHLHQEDDTVVNPDGPFLDSAGAAGNLHSSVNNLAQWVRLHLGEGTVDGHAIVDAKQLALTYVPRIALDGPIAADVRLGQHDTMSYATGWMTHATPQGRLIEHAGGTIGYNSHIGFDPDRKFGFIVLVNQSYQGGTGLAIPLGKTIADLLQGRPDHDYPGTALSHIHQDMADRQQRWQPPADARAPRPHDAYTGTYHSPALGTIKLQSQNDETLTFDLGPYAIPVSLKPYSGDVFHAAIPVPTYDGRPSHVDHLKVQFVADEHDHIVRMLWLGDGDNAGQPPFERQNQAD